jgi:hypothetical protein
MPHTEDCSIRTRSGLEEVTGLRLSLSDTRRGDFTENPEIGQWQFLPDANAPTRRAPFGQGERPARRQPGEVGPILRSGWSRQGSSPPALGLRVAAPRHLDLEREPGEGRYPDRQRPELEVLLQERVNIQRVRSSCRALRRG